MDKKDFLHHFENGEPLPDGDKGSVEIAPVPKLTLLQILVGLFFHPRFTLLIVRLSGVWKRPLLFIFLAAFLAAFVNGRLLSDDIVEEFSSLTALVGESCQELSIQDGELRWSKDVPLPFSASNPSWRLDLMQGNAPLDAEALKTGIEPKGVILSPSGLNFWMRDPSGTAIYCSSALSSTLIGFRPLSPSAMASPAFSASQLGSLFNVLGTKDASGSRLSAEDLKKLPRRLRPAFAIASAAIKVVTYLEPLFLCTILFVVFSLLFNRRDYATFGGILGSAICSCLPPLLIAMIYDQLPLFEPDFNLLFVISFVIYFIIILCDHSIKITKITTPVH